MAPSGAAPRSGKSSLPPSGHKGGRKPGSGPGSKPKYSEVRSGCFQLAIVRVTGAAELVACDPQVVEGSADKELIEMVEREILDTNPNVRQLRFPCFAFAASRVWQLVLCESMLRFRLSRSLV